MDERISSLLGKLRECDDDPRHLIWAYISDAYEDGDCTTALRLMVAVQLAHQHGWAARLARDFDSCPYPAFDGAPMVGNDYLRIAWMGGYNDCDCKKRCEQAERHIYNAYKELGDMRDFVDARTDAGISTREMFNQKLRNIHGTILTAAVKQRVIEEEKEARELQMILIEEQKKGRRGG